MDEKKVCKTCGMDLIQLLDPTENTLTIMCISEECYNNLTEIPWFPQETALH